MAVTVNGVFFRDDQVASGDVDAENGFTPLCQGELPVPEGHLIVPELNAQARYAGSRFFTKDAHPPNPVWEASEKSPQFSPTDKKHGSNVDMHWNLHCVVGTYGFCLIAGLPSVIEYNFWVYAGLEGNIHPYGKCYHDQAERISTGLIEWLTVRNIKVVIIGGLATDYCVKLTVLQLLRAGFIVVVNLGGCRGVAPETTQTAIQEMKEAGAYMVDCADDLQHDIKQVA